VSDGHTDVTDHTVIAHPRAGAKTIHYYNNKIMFQVHGVKGASPLMILSYVDLPRVFVIDWMHSVLLGVTKTLLKLWFGSSNATEEFYIGDKVIII
jgi:hypothetical protein